MVAMLKRMHTTAFVNGSGSTKVSASSSATPPLLCERQRRRPALWHRGPPQRIGQPAATRQQPIMPSAG